MAGDEGLSWKAQLGQVRSRVEEMEERRATEKRLQRERNEQALTVRLKEDTPEALKHRFGEIRQRADRAARKFYPLPHLEKAIAEIGDFGDLVRFYADCIKSFPKVFAPNHKPTFASLLAEIGTLQRGLERQLKQWRDVNTVMEKVTFRAREGGDNAALVAVAKAFSEHAHSVPLSIPGDYFAHEKNDFWVADCEGAALGYVKYWPTEKVVAFALSPDVEVNFNKFVRGILYSFCARGPLSEPMPAVRVRVGYVREVRFFTDIGFVREETMGPSDWIYHRELD